MSFKTQLVLFIVLGIAHPEVYFRLGKSIPSFLDCICWFLVVCSWEWETERDHNVMFWYTLGWSITSGYSFFYFARV